GFDRPEGRGGRSAGPWLRAGPPAAGVGGGKEAMVSQAWKLRWGRVAFGLALVPALAVVNVAPAQTGTPSSSFAAVRDADPAAGKPSADAEEAVRSLVKQGRDALKAGDKARAEML